MEESSLFPKDLDLSNPEVSKLYKENTELKKRITTLEENNWDAPYLRPDKIFGIAVCGDVMLNEMEVEIINTPEFQRLRKIKQLGSTFLVYPSAVHTRFEHSIGVLKKADLIINRIRKNRHSNSEEKKITPNEEQIIRLLALLHDIGHMPYGHTIEDEFGLFKSHDRHETRWEILLGKYSNIGKIIIKYHKEEFHETFFNLIKCEKDFLGLGDFAFMYDIVSNTVCADLLDYLERDCTYTNLKIKYHPRFLEFFFIKKMKTTYEKKEKKGTREYIERITQDERRIAIRVFKQGRNKERRHDVISELIQLLRNRYYLGERVYYHHAKIMTGTLLSGAVLRAKKANCFIEHEIKGGNIQETDALKKLITENKDDVIDKTLYNLHFLGDEELVLFLKNLKKGGDPDLNKYIEGAIKLAEYFEMRHLFHELYVKTKSDLHINYDFDVKPIIDNQLNKVRNKLALKLYEKFIMPSSYIKKLEIEDGITSYLKDMASGDFLIYCPSFNMAMKLAKMKVANKEGEIFELKDFQDHTIQEECHSILNKHQDLWALRVFVNPKFIKPPVDLEKGKTKEKDKIRHKDYEEKYSSYEQLLQLYSQWHIFSADDIEETENSKKFFEAYIRYLLSTIKEPANVDKIYNHNTDKNIEQLVNEFSVNTNLYKNGETILTKIKEKFSLDA